MSAKSECFDIDERDAQWQRGLADLHLGSDGDGCDSGDPIDWTRAAIKRHQRRLLDAADSKIVELTDRAVAAETERDALRASFASQAQVTVTARQAVSDVVVQRDAALAELEKAKAELRQAYLNMQDREFMRG